MSNAKDSINLRGPEAASPLTGVEAMTYDRVYWWSRTDGSWHEAIPGLRIPYSTEPAKSAEQLRAELRQMGYVAHLGKKSIGAPEGAPSEAELAAVLG